MPERLIFNCTGPRQPHLLFDDTGLQPARGQLAILLPQPEMRYAFTGGDGYMFPRPDGILLGGTFELDEWNTTPEPETIARIIRLAPGAERAAPLHGLIAAFLPRQFNVTLVA